MDVTRGLPYDSDSVDVIYSSHMLEHVHLDQAEGLLREFRRVLRSDGICRLALPDGEALARQLIADLDAGVPEASRRYNERLHSHPVSAPSTAERYLAGFTGAVHRWQPTAQLVADLLRVAGFGTIQRCAFRVGCCPDLDLVEMRPDSLFFEASPTSIRQS